jgi:hypothetical protein
MPYTERERPQGHLGDGFACSRMQVLGVALLVQTDGACTHGPSWSVEIPTSSGNAWFYGVLRQAHS